uniref:Tumor necrosis factor receptor superfamily member 6 n=1 Tax=Pelusios castaneus TaxID=367368 RepID=A0A8C8SE95_9SAUR
MNAGLRFLLALVLGGTIGSQCESDIPDLHSVHVKLSRQRNISKRENTCKEREYPAENTCCEKCEPGSFKHRDCTQGSRTNCTQCTEGLTFMDYFNSETKCRRCQSCDTTFGLEVAEKCIITQNTKCRCAQHHYCNSSTPCKHCEQCDDCRNGAVEKECTPTTNTICKSKDKKKRKNFDLNKQEPDRVVHRPHISVEMEPLMYTDVDLSTHIPVIVDEMTLQQVKSFIRKQKIPEPAIEQALQDNLNDSTEQKIKLFHIWYQEHGMKGAYGNLISSLRELKMRAIADKIEKKIDVITSSTQDNGKSNVKTAEKSSAHSDGHLEP